MATGSHQNGSCWWSHEVPRGVGNRQGNSARCFLYFLNEINSLGCHFEPHQPPHLPVSQHPTKGQTSCKINGFAGRLRQEWQTFGDPVVTGLLAQRGAEVLAQRVHPDVLDGDDGLVHGTLRTSAGGLSDVSPVGGLLANASMPRGLHERLEQHGAVVVSPLPVMG